MSILLAAATFLSILETEDSSCRWSRVDARTGKAEVLARVDDACASVSIAWSADARRALLWAEHFDGSNGSHRFFEVEIAKHAVRELPAPPRVWITGAGFDERDRPTFFSVEGLPSEGPDAAVVDKESRTFTHHGIAYPLAADWGLPAFAHAWTLIGGAWEKVETAATMSEACETPGERVLTLWHVMRKHPASPQSPEPELAGGAVRIGSVLAARGDDDGPMDGYSIAAPIRVGDRVLEEFTAPRGNHIQIVDGLVLVTAGANTARVYDETTGALVLDVTTADVALFWPE